MRCSSSRQCQRQCRRAAGQPYHAFLSASVQCSAVQRTNCVPSAPAHHTTHVFARLSVDASCHPCLSLSAPSPLAALALPNRCVRVGRIKPSNRRPLLTLPNRRPTRRLPGLARHLPESPGFLTESELAPPARLGSCHGSRQVVVVLVLALVSQETRTMEKKCETGFGVTVCSVPS